MTKKEILEIKKIFNPFNCCISRICGCYVDANKEKITQFKEAFLSLPEEATFKYFEIFRKALTGKIEKNLYNLEFPLAAEKEGEPQPFLMELRNSRLTDDGILEKFYDSVIKHYDMAGNYLILLIHGSYDIPGKTSNGQNVFDASDEVYDHILCCICPMNLAKPGLAYNEKEQCIQNRKRDWIVEMPANAFLFPAFNDRSADIHALLYYSKKSEDLNETFLNNTLGLKMPITAGEQKELFQAIVETFIGESVDFDTAKDINDNLLQYVEEQKMNAKPPEMDKMKLCEIFESSGVDEEKIKDCRENCDDLFDGSVLINAENIVNESKFEIKTGTVTVQAKPEDAPSIRMETVDGRKCIIIEASETVYINGMETS